MKHFDIVPYKSVGIADFGDSREIVRSKIDLPYDASTIELTKTFSVEQDFFPGIRVKAFYNDKANLEAIEFFRPNIFFQKNNLLKCSYDFLLDFFQIEDADIQAEPDCFTSAKLGIRIGKKAGENRKRPESAVVFDRDYLHRAMPSAEDIINEFLNGKK